MFKIILIFLLFTVIAVCVFTFNALIASELELATTKSLLEVKERELRVTEFGLNATKNDLEQAESSLNKTEMQLEQSSKELSSLKVSYSELEEKAEENKFFFYYVKPEEQEYGISRLKSYINSYSWDKKYQEGIFDCTEMSTALERDLENQGFHTIIVRGNSPWGSGGTHAWLLVETSKGKYTPVEATGLFVVKSYDKYFYNYFEYEQPFENIQEALDYNQEDYDWWEQ